MVLKNQDTFEFEPRDAYGELGGGHASVKDGSLRKFTDEEPAVERKTPPKGKKTAKPTGGPVPAHVLAAVEAFTPEPAGRPRSEAEIAELASRFAAIRANRGTPPEPRYEYAGAVPPVDMDHPPQDVQPVAPYNQHVAEQHRQGQGQELDYDHAPELPLRR